MAKRIEEEKVAAEEREDEEVKFHLTVTRTKTSSGILERTNLLAAALNLDNSKNRGGRAANKN